MFLYLFLLSIVLLYIYFKNKFSYWSKRGLTNPTPWPFVGTSIEETFSLDGRAIEEKFLKLYGHTFGTYAGTKPIFNTSNPEHIKQILNDSETFYALGSFQLMDNYISKSIFFLNGPVWKSHRQAMSHQFSSGNLRSLFPHFDGVTKSFIENVDQHNKETDNGPINIKFLMKCYGMDCISKFVFSINMNSYAEKDSEFKRLILRIGEINNFQGFLQLFLPALVVRLLKINSVNVEPPNKLGKLFKKMLQQRKNDGVKYNDLSEMLLKAREENKVDMDEDTMIGNCMLTYLAGVETVSGALCNILKFLCENPDVKERLVNELKKEFNDEITYEPLTQHAYLDAVINESLRLGTSIFIQERTAMKDCYVGEHFLEKGQEIYVIPYIAHTHPDNYPNPKKFDPERFMDKSSNNPNTINGGTFLPFSTGRKQCLGKLLALVEIKYLLAKILLTYDVKKPKDWNLKRECIRGFDTINRLDMIFERK